MSRVTQMGTPYANHTCGTPPAEEIASSEANDMLGNGPPNKRSAAGGTAVLCPALCNPSTAALPAAVTHRKCGCVADVQASRASMTSASAAACELECRRWHAG